MRYSFTTYWHLEAPIEKVWAVIVDPGNWPEWWKYVKIARRLEPGDELGVGATVHNEWSTALPYTLKFDVRTVRIEKPHLLERPIPPASWTASAAGRSRPKAR